MQALVDAGAEVNTRDSLGCTPLYDAVARGNDVATKMLLTVPSVDIQVREMIDWVVHIQLKMQFVNYTYFMCYVIF